MQNWQKYAAEAYGTFVLVLFGTGAILATNGDPVGIAFGFSLALLAALYTVGRISGGHFNPAVSLAAFLDKRMALNNMLSYWVFQIVGAVLASLVLAFVTTKEAVALTVTALNPSVEPFQGFVWEALLTTVFVMAILVLARRRRGRRSRFLGVALTLAAVNFAGMGISGASVNPVRSFGPALVSGEWTDIWVYVAGPVLGAIVAWVLYKVIVSGDMDFTVGSASTPAAAAVAAPPKKPATAARKPAAKKPAARKPAARKPAAKR